jgi:hypothetical protein
MCVHIYVFAHSHIHDPQNSNSAVWKSHILIGLSRTPAEGRKGGVQETGCQRVGDSYGLLVLSDRWL